jgi:hypothetical protein
MFILLRRTERWLHQHIFKVGWLVTQNFQTTTILYYTFFLPGVVLHEVVYWLAAGIFNVRAERKIEWPEPQEIGELKLNFVELPSRTSTYQKALISIMPLLVGIVSIWLIANNVFDIQTAFDIMSTGELRDVAAGFGELTSAPDFWLWLYLVFTIANTMYPHIPKDLQGWRTILGAVLVVTLVLLVIGLGGEIFEALTTPLSSLITVLQLMAVLLLGIDFIMVLILGTIEYTIERVTGNSATFRGGKMIVMTREEMIEEERKAREREQRRAERERRRRGEAQTTITSVYMLDFPIPGAPSDTFVTEVDIPEPEIVATPPDHTPPPANGDDIAMRINIPSQQPTLFDAMDTSDVPEAPAETLDTIASPDDLVVEPPSLAEDAPADDEPVRSPAEFVVEPPQTQERPPSDPPPADVAQEIDDALSLTSADDTIDTPESIDADVASADDDYPSPSDTENTATDTDTHPVDDEPALDNDLESFFAAFTPQTSLFDNATMPDREEVETRNDRETQTDHTAQDDTNDGEQDSVSSATDSPSTDSPSTSTEIDPATPIFGTAGAFDPTATDADVPAEAPDPTTSIFGSAGAFSPTPTDDDITADDNIANTDDDTSDDDDAQPARPRFDRSALRSRVATHDDDDSDTDDDTSDDDAQPARPRFDRSAFRSRVATHDDDDSDADSPSQHERDQSRRQAFDELFGGERNKSSDADADNDTSADEMRPATPRTRRFSRQARLGQSRPAPKPDDDATPSEEATTDNATAEDGETPAIHLDNVQTDRFSFGSSRPAPKPFAGDDVEDQLDAFEADEDSLIYEDDYDDYVYVDDDDADVYYVDDDDDYIDYDDL